MDSNTGEFKRIYLDHAATTPVDRRVIEKMLPFWSENFGNPSSVHFWGQAAKEAVHSSRMEIAESLNCNPEEIVFTSGGTESINLALKGVAAVQGKGHIITSKIEHHALLEPLKQLAEQGFEITFLDVDQKGFVKPEDVAAALRDDTFLVSIMYANNEMGAIQPISEIGAITKAAGVLFHTDACQAAMSLDLDVEKLNVDLLTINASKIYGPKGVGLLYVREGANIEPLISGGGQEMELRGGTENVPAIVGFAEALKLITTDQEIENKRLMEMRTALIKGLLERCEEAVINGPLDHRLPNNVNCSFPGIEGESLLLRLDMEGVGVSSGSACTSNDLEPSHVLKAMGLDDERVFGSIRFTFGKNNHIKDIPEILDRVERVVRDLRRISDF